MIKECKHCESKRILRVHVGGTKGFFCASTKKHECSDYVPYDIGLGDDYCTIDFSYCLDCGMIQAKFPIKTPFTKDRGWTKKGD